MGNITPYKKNYDTRSQEFSDQFINQSGWL